MLKKIKFYFLMDCVVFTLMTIVLNIFYKLIGIPVDEEMAYTTLTFQYFAVSTTMAVLFFISDCVFGIKSHIIPATIVIGTVFIEGGYLFGWFPIASYWVLAVLGIIAVLYISVYLMLFAKSSMDSKEINKKLNELKENENEKDS